MGARRKIAFTLYGDLVSGESVWAEQVGTDTYCLLNIPFNSFGYAEGDVVRCVDRDGWNEVVELVQDSGNGTLLLMFANSRSPEAIHVLDELVSVGCTLERASDRLVAVTVPPTLDVPFSQLANFLNDYDPG